MVIGQCGDWWHAHRAAGRADSRDDGHPDTDQQGHDDRPALEHERPRRQGDAEPFEKGLETLSCQNAESQPDERGQGAHDDRFGQNGAEYLSAAGPHDAQQRQLPRALPHRDRKGVEDGEPTDEEGDEGEDQQGGGEEGQGLVDVAGLLVGHCLTGHHLDPLGQGGRDGMLHGLFVGARGRQDIHGVVASDLPEDPLGGGQVERGDGGPGQIAGVAERDDPTDGERLGRPEQQHADMVSHLEVVFLRRGGVHDDLVR